ncbi:MAG: hypothetical protein ACRDRO_26695 [Pseudonocardiaceae bacterium]
MSASGIGGRQHRRARAARELFQPAARAVQQCAETLDDPVWLGYAAWLHGNATGRLDRAAQYRRSVTAADTLTSRLDSSDAVQACGMLYLSAALAAGVQADPDTVATHLTEAAALAARMDTEVGTWAHLWFGPTNVGIWRTSLAVEIGEHGQALEVAKTVHSELLPGNVRQAEFWAEVGRALVAGKKRGTRGYACCCTLSNSPRSGSVATCLSGRPSLVCCVKPGVMPVAGSCVVWPGGWGLLRWGEPRLVCTTGAHIPGSARERLKLWGEGHHGRGEGVGAARS